MVRDNARFSAPLIWLPVQIVRDRRNPIRFVKWYLDVIDKSGHCLILYWARLDGFGVTGHFSSRTRGAPGAESVTETSLSAVPPPRREGDCIRWSHGGLAVDGSWSTEFTPVDRTLLNSDAGQIRWTLHAAAGSAAVELACGQCVGRGYVECLEMSIVPWKLPVRELRWGRANLGDESSMVWIDWIGSASRRWCFQEGREVSALRIDDAGLAWDDPSGDARMELHPVSTLRDGALGPAVLSRIPGVGRLPPAAFLASQETKWLSRATAILPGRTISGWAIHERVMFSGMVNP
ncbi:MAG: hypothetical protein IT428_23155 [Planctomycetaceae bacterium]|nr:hypothetical protein [Planctomycetaceae bacterium]